MSKEEEFSQDQLFDENSDKSEYINMLMNGVPTVIETPEEVKIVVFQDETDSEDVKTVKSNIEFIVNNAREAVSFLIQLGKQTGNPRFFETVNSLLNTINSASGQLMNVHRMKSKVEEPKTPQPTSVTNVQNNTTVQMTTTQAMEMMRKRQEGKIEAIDVTPG